MFTGEQKKLIDMHKCTREMPGNQGEIFNIFWISALRRNAKSVSWKNVDDALDFNGYINEYKSVFINVEQVLTKILNPLTLYEFVVVVGAVAVVVAAAVVW